MGEVEEGEEGRALWRLENSDVIEEVMEQSWERAGWKRSGREKNAMKGQR